MSLKNLDNRGPVAASDELLVERFRAGVQSAGEELVRRHCQSLLRYLLRLCGSEQLAEELHQQTWLSALEHLEKFDATSGRGGFRAWLFRIATNKVNDYWRWRGRDRSARTQLGLVTDETWPEAGHKLEGGEMEQKLQQAIAQLPDNQKEVLLLRYYGNLKFIEIAELLGCPLNTALGRMHKAMLKLKRLLAE